MPSVLDSMQLLKYDSASSDAIARKIRKVSDRNFLISNRHAIYSFFISNSTIACVDSLLLNDPGRGGDMYDSKNDTLVIFSRSAKRVRFHHISNDGSFEYMGDVGVDVDIQHSAIHYGHGNIYYHEWGLNVLIRENDRFIFSQGPFYSYPIEPVLTDRGIAQIDRSSFDKIDIYDADMRAICSKREVTSPYVWSCSGNGDKVFMARDDGISTWIPDTTTTTVRGSTVVESPCNFEIWPNPSTSGLIKVYSEYPIHRVLITDVIGRIVFDESGQFTQTEAISTIGFKTGIYFVELQTATGPSRRKIVVVQE
jgi:hypothetical protein